ncbi:hypothetical protein [Spirosoma sp. 209]|uniref:hypothetical protein n=1 Tax=Spirosoma sp. 209 TaxID=1955701 RepID=UPI00098D3EA9|nr:hypothetical protein [Spirosoma sp. 209]
MESNTVTVEEAGTLLTPFFYQYWFNIYRTQDVTREKAYELTEAVHQRAHPLGKRKYQDFSGFEPRISQYCPKAKSLSSL